MFFFIKSELALKCYYCPKTASCYKNREYGTEKYCSSNGIIGEHTDCFLRYDGTTTCIYLPS